MSESFHAWNPGLESDIPKQLLPLVTLFREENSSVDYKTARELSDLTGANVHSFATFTVQRLVVHHLLVRVTADLSVADGPSYQELGLNLRGMVHTIYTQYISPEMDDISRFFDQEKVKVQDFLNAQLEATLFKSEEPIHQAKPPSLLDRLLGRASKQSEPEIETGSKELQAIEQWEQLASGEGEQMHIECYHALAKLVNTTLGNHGRLRVDQALLTKIVTNNLTNTYVADQVAEYIAPLWRRAIEQEGYRTLPMQSKPVIMNVKGASASGKSTIRPEQRLLAEKLGVPWEDFALISPDYWRKYLLDYGSLGKDYKYAAMLTGTELEIIDKKLDQYMVRKQADGNMSHLLIDRFRFDSFTVNIDSTTNSQLLSRFGEEVYLFFMITPPSETVVRAWKRGKETGRYKAVDDLLYHNVEAFTGMPALFLSWINSKHRKVHFEFLDNDVPLGDLPKTAAFGSNESMTILDLSLMLNIDRYRHINLGATDTAQVLKYDTSDIERYTKFIMQCAKTVHRINFADQETLQIYATIDDGKLCWWDDAYLQSKKADLVIHKTLTELGYEKQPAQLCDEPVDTHIDKVKVTQLLVGQFGQN